MNIERKTNSDLAHYAMECLKRQSDFRQAVANGDVSSYLKKSKRKFTSPINVDEFKLNFKVVSPYMQEQQRNNAYEYFKP